MYKIESKNVDFFYGTTQALKNINIIYMDKYLNKSYNKISELQKYSAHIIFDGDKILNTFKLRDMSIAGCEIYSKIINLVGEF